MKDTKPAPSRSGLLKVKEVLKDLIYVIDVLNYDEIDENFFKKSVLEHVFKEMNKFHNQFDLNRNRTRYVNRAIYPNIVKQINKISESCKHNDKKVAYIRRCMIPQVLVQVIYLYNLCESKPFDHEIKFMEQFVVPKCLKIFSILYKNFGECEEGQAAKEEMLVIMRDSDYCGHLSWSTYSKQFYFVPHTRKKPKDYVDPVCGPEQERLLFGGDIFASCLDGFHILHFLNNFQLEKTDVITLQYIKSITLYTTFIKIPVAFIHFFYTETVDQFLRALLVYFQYFLQLQEVAQKRAKMRRIKLPHANSEYYESIWQNNLNDLRYFVARNYTAIVIGCKDLINFHHMNSPKGINTTTDYLLYELLFDFSAKIVKLVLNHENNENINNIVQNEIDRLFRERVGGHDRYYIGIEEQERRILEGKFRIPREWRCRTPCLTEVKRPGRDERIFYAGTTIMKTRNLRLRIFQTALLIPDESLKKANMKIGILGKLKKDYPPLLSCYQIRRSDFFKKNVDVKKDDSLISKQEETNSELRRKTIESTNETQTRKSSKDMKRKEKLSVSAPKSDQERVPDDGFEENDEMVGAENEKTKVLVAIELFLLLLSMKKERSRQKKLKRFIKKMKRRFEAENMVGGEGTYLVDKDHHNQPYCLSIRLLTKPKTIDRNEAISMWMKYSSASKRFFYRIDPYSSIIDEYYDRKL